MKLLLLLLLIPLTFQLNAQTIVQHDISGKIQDMKTTTVKVDKMNVSKVGKFSLHLNIRHNDFEDLVIKLNSPEGKVFVLADNNLRGSGKLKLRLTQANFQLHDIVGVNAKGIWSITVLDNKKRNSGTITYLKIEVSEYQRGDDSTDPVVTPTQPHEPSPTTPTVDLPGEGNITTDAECRKRWDSFLAKRNLDPKYASIKYLCNEVLVRQLRNVIKAHHKTHSYGDAREFMFSELDNVNGEVCGVYTARCIRTRHIPKNEDMNCEHTWPKSKGAGSSPAKMDLHHLFPTDSRINSSRSSYPFCEVEVTKLEKGGSRLGTRGRSTCFEPRDPHKGDVARAMLYFSVRYDMRIDSEQESFFRKWNKQDGVSRDEVIRNLTIEKYQGNRNPFVEYPELSQLISNF
jgi:endonuclease I/subtilisin-like proprotein convertase family protein